MAKFVYESQPTFFEFLLYARKNVTILDYSFYEILFMKLSYSFLLSALCVYVCMSLLHRTMDGTYLQELNTNVQSKNLTVTHRLPWYTTLQEIQHGKILKKSLLFFYCICVCICVCVHVHACVCTCISYGVCVKIKGQLVEVYSFLLPCGTQGLIIRLGCKLLYLLCCLVAPWLEILYHSSIEIQCLILLSWNLSCLQRFAFPIDCKRDILRVLGYKKHYSFYLDSLSALSSVMNLST